MNFWGQKSITLKRIQINSNNVEGRGGRIIDNYFHEIEAGALTFYIKRTIVNLHIETRKSSKKKKS